MRFLSAVIFGLLAPAFAGAAFPVLNYKTVECKLWMDGQVVQERSGKMMTLTIDEHLGRFVQIQFGDEKQKIQYQLLIEDDVESKTLDSLLVLQNLMVDSLESSSEFVSNQVSWVRIAQGAVSVTCAVNP